VDVFWDSVDRVRKGCCENKVDGPD